MSPCLFVCFTYAAGTLSSTLKSQLHHLHLPAWEPKRLSKGHRARKWQRKLEFKPRFQWLQNLCSLLKHFLLKTDTTVVPRNLRHHPKWMGQCWKQPFCSFSVYPFLGNLTLKEPNYSNSKWPLTFMLSWMHAMSCLTCWFFSVGRHVSTIFL